MTYVKVQHGSGTPAAATSGPPCRFATRRLVVKCKESSESWAQASKHERIELAAKLRFSPRICPTCQVTLTVNPERFSVTEGIPHGFEELRDGVGMSRHPRRLAAAFPALTGHGRTEEIPTIDPSDCSDESSDAFTPRKSHFSAALRLSQTQRYDHHPSGDIQATLDAGDPSGLQSHRYDTFRRGDKAPGNPRDQKRAIKTHYKEAGQPQRASLSNPHISIVQAAKYAADGVAKHYGAAPSAESKVYEWNHVRADALGGLNCRSNLFAASFFCNSFMLVLETAVSRAPATDVQVEVTTYYESKKNPDGSLKASRGSSRLCPLFVRYALQRGRVQMSFLINARCKGFTADDQQWVESRLAAIQTTRGAMV